MAPAWAVSVALCCSLSDAGEWRFCLIPSRIGSKVSASLVKRFTFLLLAFSCAVFAQSNTGAITGTVFDQSQAVMNGVKITATNLATNVTQTATTNNDGIYSIPALEPGSYRVTLEKEGFKKLIREPITVEGSGTVA